MKAYTDIEQSRRLLEIGIPAESADMEWILEQWYDYKIDKMREGWSDIPVCKVETDNELPEPITLSCWSLAALLELIKKHGLINLRFLNSTFDNKGNHLKNIWNIIFEDIGVVIHDVYAVNPVDAAYDMIIWLKENKYI